MSKYRDNKPLIFRTGYTPDKFLLSYHKFEPPKPIELLEFIGTKPIENIPREMVFGIKRSHEDFTLFSFLECYEGGPPILHQRVLEVLNDICPHDFQVFPIVIKNIRSKDPEIQNQDYYILNLLYKIDVLDFEQSRLRFDNPQTLDNFNIIKPFFKENSMNGHHLGYIKKKYSAVKVISPYLANHLTKLRLNKGAKFLTEEQAYPKALPEEYLEYKIQKGEFEAARRYFVSILNNRADFEEFKKYIHLLPVSTIEKLIELILARSTFQQKECDELRALLKERNLS